MRVLVPTGVQTEVAKSAEASTTTTRPLVPVMFVVFSLDGRAIVGSRGRMCSLLQRQ